MTPRDYLYSLEQFGIKLGLDNIRCLLQAAGDPHLAYPTIHVGGTNGKGSVAAMLDAMFRAAGYRTGRFISPHLIHVNERFLCSGVPIDDAALDDAIEYFRHIAERMPHPPTFFELNTAMAFRWFAQQKVDVAVIEVGMGGRFDSTNVVAPEAATITNIALEHTQYLGETLEEIAFEKAGIVKPGVPLVLTEIQPAPQAVILARAAECNAPVRLIDRDFAFTLSGPAMNQRLSYRGPGISFDDVPMALHGRHQGPNAAAAAATAEAVQDRFPGLTRAAVVEGIKSALWPCRLEQVLDDPPVIIDVAHNAAGMEAIAAALPRCVLLMAVSSDKNAQDMLAAVCGCAETLIFTQFHNRRALPAEALHHAAGQRAAHVEPDLASAVALGIRLARESSLPLVIAGSVFLAGEAREILVCRHSARPLQF